MAKRKFKPQTPWIKAEMAREKARLATPLRPYSDMGAQRSKAAEYAIWLARRDGVQLPADTATSVEMTRVPQAGFDAGCMRATRVRFGRADRGGEVIIELPHVHYDPTIPAIEHLD
jgi:hypothetical protein